MKGECLLHVCCAPDSLFPADLLRSLGYEVVFFFHNPNIFPKEEYELRWVETFYAGQVKGVEVLEGERNFEEFRRLLLPYASEEEGGKRCEVCIRERLRATAKKAAQLGFPCFTTTLTISPHKNLNAVFAAGERAASEFGVEFLALDFKEKGGFARSVAESRELGIYRQYYCGCSFSLHFPAYTSLPFVPGNYAYMVALRRLRLSGWKKGWKVSDRRFLMWHLSGDVSPFPLYNSLGGVRFKKVRSPEELLSLNFHEVDRRCWMEFEPSRFYPQYHTNGVLSRLEAGEPKVEIVGEVFTVAQLSSLERALVEVESGWALTSYLDVRGRTVVLPLPSGEFLFWEDGNGEKVVSAPDLVAFLQSRSGD